MSSTGDSTRFRVVLITGLSGSGKSIAANAFEDLGYYCLDNLPFTLLRQLLREPEVHAGDRHQIAVVTDVRSPGFAQAMPKLLESIDRSQVDLLVVYLETAESVLVRRYSETRRSHPMGEGERPVLDGIRQEIHVLKPWREAADLIFDTTDWSVHDMKRAIHRQFGDAEIGASLVVSVVSFGFKYGPPAGADVMLDVRFLDNPYFIPGLREKTGQDQEIRDFLGGLDDYRDLLDRLESLLDFLLPRYQRENRRYLTVAIGCTGGRHRSVATSEHLYRHLKEGGWSVRLSHRDVER